MPTDPQNTSHSVSDTKLFYHILVGSPNDPKVDVWDVTAESVDQPEAAVMGQNIRVYEEPDLAVFESTAPSNSHVIGIQPGYSGENFYFRVAAAHTAAGSISESESSALPLKGNRIPTDRRPLQSLTLSGQIGFSLQSSTMCVLPSRYPLACLLEKREPMQHRDK